jgi:hypothetical protein
MSRDAIEAARLSVQEDNIQHWRNVVEANLCADCLPEAEVEAAYVAVPGDECTYRLSQLVRVLSSTPIRKIPPAQFWMDVIWN